jgi:predicted thioesterase
MPEKIRTRSRYRDPVEASIEISVTDADTAIALRSGDVAVLGTPRVVALCEEACVAALGPQPDGRTTVGTRIEVDHTKPTLVGGTARADARLTETSTDRRRFEFEVVVVDGDGEEVARARHWRTSVNRARFGG